MSVVTGIVLCLSSDDEPGDDKGSPMNMLNDWLKQRRFGALAQVDSCFGGEKHPQMAVFGGGYNHLPAAEFAEFVMSLPWIAPENVVLIMQPEDGGTQIRRAQG